MQWVVLTEGSTGEGAREEGLSSRPIRVWVSNDFPSLTGGNQHSLFTRTYRAHDTVL